MNPTNPTEFYSQNWLIFTRKKCKYLKLNYLSQMLSYQDELLNEAKALHIEMLEGRKNFLTTTLIARELPESRKRITKVLNRGEYMLD